MYEEDSVKMKVNELERLWTIRKGKKSCQQTKHHTKLGMSPFWPIPGFELEEETFVVLDSWQKGPSVFALAVPGLAIAIVLIANQQKNSHKKGGIQIIQYPIYKKQKG